MIVEMIMLGFCCCYCVSFCAVAMVRHHIKGIKMVWAILCSRCFYKSKLCDIYGNSMAFSLMAFDDSDEIIT